MFDHHDIARVDELVQVGEEAHDLVGESSVRRWLGSIHVVRDHTDVCFGVAKSERLRLVKSTLSADRCIQRKRGLSRRANTKSISWPRLSRQYPISFIWRSACKFVEDQMFPQQSETILAKAAPAKAGGIW